MTIMTGIPAPLWVGVITFAGIIALFALSHLALRYLRPKDDDNDDERDDGLLGIWPGHGSEDGVEDQDGDT